VRTLTRTSVAVAMAVTALAVVSVPAGAQQPIGPNQHFSGLVNGTRTSAVVNTVCGGPAWAGRTGPVAGVHPDLRLVRSSERDDDRTHATEVHLVQGAKGDPYLGAGALRRRRYGRVQLVPLPRAVRFRLDPRLRRRAVREYRGLNVRT
jgi:hypothetical protein